MSPELFAIVIVYGFCAVLAVLAQSWVLMAAAIYLAFVALMALRKEQVTRE